MTEAKPYTPVYIDQMPDYHEAVHKIVALSQDEAKLRAVVGELGLAKDYDKITAEAVSIQADAGKLRDKQEALSVRSEEILDHTISKAKKATIAGSGVALAAGAGVGYVAGKRFGILGGIAAGAAAALATAGTWLFASKKILSKPSKESIVLEKDFNVLGAQQEQLVQHQIDAGREFISAMATRMLAEQKMLVGEGADMKLVSTKESPGVETPAAGDMAAKYAVPPAASRAESVAQSAASAAAQR